MGLTLSKIQRLEAKARKRNQKQNQLEPQLQVPSNWADFDGIPRVNREKNGVYILGIHATPDAIGINLRKMYHDYKYYLIEEYIDTDINIEKSLKKCEEYISTYKIKYALGNRYGRHICKQPLSVGNSGAIIGGYEVVDIEPEELFFLVKGNRQNLIIKDATIKQNWINELKNFDITALCPPRIGGLGAVISNAKPIISMLGDCAPDILVDKNGLIIGHQTVKQNEPNTNFIYSNYRYHH